MAEHPSNNLSLRRLARKDPAPSPTLTAKRVADHLETASWGRSRGVCGYHAKINELLEQGRCDEALRRGVNDVRSINSEYDMALEEAERAERE